MFCNTVLVINIATKTSVPDHLASTSGKEIQCHFTRIPVDFLTRSGSQVVEFFVAIFMTGTVLTYFVII